MRVKVIYRTTSLFLLTLLVLMLGTGTAADRAIYIEVPLGLPEVVALKDNPPTLAKVELGKMLYFDPRLSLSGELSCATCHNPSLGYSNAAPVAVGHQHALGGRNAPTVLNAAFASTQFWDGR
jgi:cytochrome c peroxidase